MRPTGILLLALLLPLAVAKGSNDRIVTAVFSRVSNGYERPRAADGSYLREYYALTKGEYFPGVGKDSSIDPVKFPQVAGLVAQFLATKNYYFAQDAKHASLLLSIAWGKTIPLNDSVYSNNAASFYSANNTLQSLKKSMGGAQNAMGGASVPRGPDGAVTKEGMELQAAMDEFEQQMFQLNAMNDMRRQADEHNAQLLGYTDEINRRNNPSQFAGAGTAFNELVSDIEDERYYIVITAYDFAAAQKGEMKRLWATRVSVQSQGNRFNEAAAFMLAKASKYFGQDSGRLVREFDREGRVKLGELQVMGTVSDAAMPAPSQKK